MTTTHAQPTTRALGAKIVPDPWLATTVTIPATRCGPPGMANGGWVSGTLAGHLGSGPVEVTLHAPTPVDAPLELRAADDQASLSQDDRLLVSARRVPWRLRAPAPLPWADALMAEARFPGHHDHPFPGCFVCGTDRAVGDGLRLLTGPVQGRPRTAAALYRPHVAHVGIDGRLGPAGIWALLDCPTIWVAYRPGVVALLGQLTAVVTGPIRAGDTYLVVSELVGTEHRKVRSRVAVYDADERPLAVGAATWIQVS